MDLAADRLRLAAQTVEHAVEGDGVVAAINDVAGAGEHGRAAAPVRLRIDEPGHAQDIVCVGEVAVQVCDRHDPAVQSLMGPARKRRGRVLRRRWCAKVHKAERGGVISERPAPSSRGVSPKCNSPHSRQQHGQQHPQRKSGSGHTSDVPLDVRVS